MSIASVFKFNPEIVARAESAENYFRYVNFSIYVFTVMYCRFVVIPKTPPVNNVAVEVWNFKFW